MSTPLAILREYRRRAFVGASAARDPLPALFVLCAECVPAAAFAAAADPAMVLQNFGGALPPSADRSSADQATVHQALTRARVGHVVLCGHARCNAVHAPPGERPSRRASQDHLLLQRERAAAMARALEVGVRIHALWFDEDEGDVYAYRPEERRFTLLSDLDVERLLADLAGGAPERAA
jgi:carbonic anhydrase